MSPRRKANPETGGPQESRPASGSIAPRRATGEQPRTSVRAVRADALSTAAAADLFDVDERTIRRWVRSGCPHHPGKAGHRAPTFDLEAITEWRQQNILAERELVGALVRRLDAQSHAVARQIERIGREYLDREEVTATWAGECARVRARLSRVPAELRAEVMAVAADGPHAIEAAMDLHVRALLTDLAAGADAEAPTDTPAPARREVRASVTVREARSQLAAFQADVLGLRDAILLGSTRLDARQRRHDSSYHRTSQGATQ